MQARTRTDKRITISLNERDVALIDRVRDHFNAYSVSDAIRQALRTTVQTIEAEAARKPAKKGKR